MIVTMINIAHISKQFYASKNPLIVTALELTHSDWNMPERQARRDSSPTREPTHQKIDSSLVKNPHECDVQARPSLIGWF
jgi:hypothetical protein